jgi:hypothetical protein
MADSVGEEIEDALQLLVISAEQSTKIKKELKQTKLDTLSTLRDLIVKLHVSKKIKADEIRKLEKQVGDLKAELNECRHRAAKVISSPSSDKKLEPTGQAARTVAPLCGRGGKLPESEK